MLEGVTVRRRYLFALDVGLLVLSFLLAVALRFETLPSLLGPIADQLPILWLSLLIRPVGFWAFGLYRRVWRYATTVDLGRALLAGVATSAALFAANFGVLRLLGLPYSSSYSVFALDALVSTGLVGGIRVLRKLATQLPQTPARTTVRLDDRDRVLIIGANGAGELVVRQMMQDQSASTAPIGFLDDNLVMRRMTIHGVPVLGAPSEMHAIATEHQADLVVIAGTTDESLVRDVVTVGRRLGIPVKTAGFVAPDLHEYDIAGARRRDTAERESRHDLALTGADAEGHFDLAVIGLGYVGLPIVVAASNIGLRVLGLDIDEARIAGLARGISHIEDISDGELQKALDSGFVPTSDPSLLARADAISISVPTPLADDLPDLSAVLAAARDVGRNLVRGQMVILESTTYPGTTDEVVLPILEEESGMRAGADFDLAYSPERIDPGNKEWRVEDMPKLVGGHSEAAGERAAAFYGKFFREVVTLSGTREAEMAKLLENTYRHVNIALVNEMAVFCHDMGVDIWEAIRGAATKPFGFQPFYPGPGVGGHCIPIDPAYLSYRVRQLGGKAKFVELAQEINNQMPQYVADRAAEVLAGHDVDIAAASVLVVGVAYKPNVADTRETPATRVVRSLRAHGADVSYHDPLVEGFVVDGQPVPREVDLVEAAAGADLVILHTPHDAIDLAAMSDAAQATLDTRGTLSGPGIHRL